MKNDQLSFLAPPTMPEGLRYAPDFLGAPEETALVRRMEALPFQPFEFHGFLGKRETVSFGWSYRFDGSGLAEAEPIPDWLLPVRARAAAFAELEPGALEHALLIRYGEGAGIGWHRDRAVFGEVFGISLLSPAPCASAARPGRNGSDSRCRQSRARSTCCQVLHAANGSTAWRLLRRVDTRSPSGR